MGAAVCFNDNSLNISTITTTISQILTIYD